MEKSILRGFTDTDMEEKDIVIAAASSYSRKFYINPDYLMLPREIQTRIKRICVGFVEEMGGDLSLELNDQNELIFRTAALEHDYYYDEIGAGLKVKEISRNNLELLYQLETYAKYKRKLSEDQDNKNNK